MAGSSAAELRSLQRFVSLHRQWIISHIHKRKPGPQIGDCIVPGRMKRPHALTKTREPFGLKFWPSATAALADSRHLDRAATANVHQQA